MNFQELIDQLFANSWRAGILIAALFAFRGVLRRFLDARVIYWFWVLVALRLLLPFDVPVSVSAARYLPPAPWTYAGDFDTVPSASTSAPVVPGSVAPPAAASLREILLNEKTLAIVWAAGVATVLLAYFRASLSFRRQLSRSGRRAGKRTEQAVSSNSRAMGLNPIPVLEMDALSGPALFGAWRPRLLFPLGLADQLSDEELRLVVLHELGHLKRRDLFLQGLLVVSQAVHWFNPLVWLAGRLAREDRELACDEFVMAHTSHSGSHAYAKTLLRVLGLSRPGRPMLPAVGILETKNQLKERIIMIQNYQSTNARRLMLGAASILAVSAGLLMASDAGNASASSASATGDVMKGTCYLSTDELRMSLSNGKLGEIKSSNMRNVTISPVGNVDPNTGIGTMTMQISGERTGAEGDVDPSKTPHAKSGIKEPHLGVVVGALSEGARAQLGFAGVLVEIVALDSPAEKAGVQQFDVIRAFNDQVIFSGAQLTNLVKQSGAGKKVSLTLYRGGKDKVIEAVLEDRGENDDIIIRRGNPEAAIGDPTAGNIIIPEINFTNVSVQNTAIP